MNFDKVDNFSDDDNTYDIGDNDVQVSGIGLDLEHIRNLLKSKFDTSISKDDPILMIVTILNSFIFELEKLNNMHNQAVTKIMVKQTSDYVTEVKQTSGQLGETLKQASIETIRSIFEQHSESLHNHKTHTKWCAFIIALSAIINVGVFILLSLRVSLW